MFVSISDGLIAAVGPADVIRAQFTEALFDEVIDASGMCILPGEIQSLLLVFLTARQQAEHHEQF